MAKVLIKRIYDPFETSDGLRIFVDRLWPRGMKKENARTDIWLKEIAPSSDLRKWFHHDPKKWSGFVEKYEMELKKSEALKTLKEILEKHKTITLLFASNDMEHNNAVALQGFLKTHTNKI